MRHCKDKIAGSDVASTQSQLNRIRSTRTADGIRDTYEICKGRLKGFDLSTEDIASAFQNTRYGSVNRGLLC
jgi:hypothetical protein